MKKYKRQSVEYKDCLFKHEDKDLGETQRCYKMILVISGKSFNYRRNTYEESIHENTTLKIYMVRYTCIMISEVFFVNTILNVSFKKNKQKKNLKELIKQNLNKKSWYFHVGNWHY